MAVASMRQPAPEMLFSSLPDPDVDSDAENEEPDVPLEAEPIIGMEETEDV
jgi:predicted protein tyrosine phosphatase